MVEYLNELVGAMAKGRGLASPALLTEELHVYPDFHGNRLLADPSLKGMVRCCRLLGFGPGSRD